MYQRILGSYQSAVFLLPPVLLLTAVEGSIDRSDVSDLNWTERWRFLIRNDSDSTDNSRVKV
jgi:hypothetical protein